MTADATSLILHQYEVSPFSEKVRVALGVKGLAWHACDQPVIMPKPEMVRLTGGYRRIPVLQVGADIFCDTQIILRELERLHPTPSLSPQNKGAPYGLGFWADRQIFQAAVAVIFGEIGDMVPEDFKKDRAAMSGGGFSAEAIEGRRPADARSISRPYQIPVRSARRRSPVLGWSAGRPRRHPRLHESLVRQERAAAPREGTSGRVPAGRLLV